MVNPFRTAVPFWGQTSLISSSLYPKRDCGSKGVKALADLYVLCNTLDNTSTGQNFRAEFLLNY